MPSQNSKSYKKRVSETPAPTDSTKKQKKANDAAPSTKKKAGPVLDLGMVHGVAESSRLRQFVRVVPF